jgi:hypothetical protein
MLPRGATIQPLPLFMGCAKRRRPASPLLGRHGVSRAPGDAAAPHDNDDPSRETSNLTRRMSQARRIFPCHRLLKIYKFFRLCKNQLNMSIFIFVEFDILIQVCASFLAQTDGENKILRMFRLRKLFGVKFPAGLPHPARVINALSVCVMYMLG